MIIFPRSCHGIVWLVCLLAFTYMFSDVKLYEMEVNLFIALIIDIFVVAIVKGKEEDYNNINVTKLFSNFSYRS